MRSASSAATYEDSDFREYQEDPSVVGINNTDPTTRLTVGKRLSDQVEFTVSQNLRENGKATFIVSYFPHRNVELRALSRDSGTVSLGIRHQVTFGGGESRPPSERRVRGRASAASRSAASIRRVAAAARAEIKIEEGDEFDFLELQKDIDRIREAFHEQGYLEARVRTRRTEAADGTVALEFIVERGPRTILEIDGIVAPAKLVEELEEAWHKNVFDQFLIDDLTQSRAAPPRHFERPGQRRRRTNRSARRRTPSGCESTSRRARRSPPVRFASPATSSSTPRALNAEIVESGLEIEAWLDRTVVEKALRQAYNEAGLPQGRSRRPAADHRRHDRRAVVRHQGRAARADHRA